MAVEVGLHAIVEQIADSITSENTELTERLIWPALDQFPFVPQLWYHAGNHLFSIGKLTLAAMAYEKAIELEPNAVCYANLGASYRQLNRADDALRVLTQSVEIDPESKSAWTNLAACYINEGTPEIGLEHANKALAIDPTFNRAQWNAGLCHLELGNFRKGFEFYEAGLDHDRILRSYGNAKYLTDPVHQNVKGKNIKLIVYGEQGIGDELMYASMLFDVCKDYDVIWDHHPRLGSFYKAAFPYLETHPTRKDDPTEEAWVKRTFAPYFISIADLGKWYRPSRNAFSKAWREHGPFYSPDPELTEQYRCGLMAMADGKKIIGISTRGGVLKTNRFYRSVKPDHLDDLLQDERYHFVNLDYEEVDVMVNEMNAKRPGSVSYWRSINHHFNYKHTAALIAATDAFVTVCQSAAHLSAAMGHPTAVLTPKRPAWRYGLKGKRWYWYPSKNVSLFRAPEDGAWDEPVANVKDWLEKILHRKQEKNNA